MTESEAKIKYDNSPEALRRRCRCIHAEIKTGGMVSPSARCGKDGRYTDPLFCAMCADKEAPNEKA
jgi:hypothetical protein